MKETMINQSKTQPELIFKADPIKRTGEQYADPQLVSEQAQKTLDCLVPVDYTAVRGTCSDERARIGLLSGADTVEIRPSMFGGP